MQPFAQGEPFLTYGKSLPVASAVVASKTVTARSGYNAGCKVWLPCNDSYLARLSSIQSSHVQKAEDMYECCQRVTASTKPWP